MLLIGRRGFNASAARREALADDLRRARPRASGAGRLVKKEARAQKLRQTLLDPHVCMHKTATICSQLHVGRMHC